MSMLCEAFWPRVIVPNGARRDATTSRPSTTKLTARETVDPPPLMATVALYAAAWRPVGFPVTLIVTVAPPAVIVLLLAEAVSHEALVETVRVVDPLPVALSVVEESLTGVVAPARPNKPRWSLFSWSVTAPKSEPAIKYRPATTVSRKPIGTFIPVIMTCDLKRSLRRPKPRQLHWLSLKVE